MRVMIASGRGYPGMHHRLALVGDSYYWSHLKDDVEAYVKTYLVCQQDKIEQGAPTGLLGSLPIPERSLESVSIDFIVGLPTNKGCTSAPMVVGRYFKYATFIPAPRMFYWASHLYIFQAYGEVLGLASFHRGWLGQPLHRALLDGVV